MGDDEDPNARLLALSDGVIAVAITLLVLDIRLPEGFGEYSDAELWAALLALGPRLLAYLISFFVIASFWFSHRSKFNHIVKTDGRLMWINMLFLLTVGLVPFTTNLIAESGGTLSTMVYAATMVVSGLSLAGIWQYAVVNKLIDPKVTREEQREHLQGTLVISLIFAISIPLSIAHADGAKYFWIALWPAGMAIRWWAATAGTGSIRACPTPGTCAAAGATATATAGIEPQLLPSRRRASAAISALVKAWPPRPQPPSGVSAISTQVRSLSDGSPAAATTRSVRSAVTPSFLSRSRMPTGVSTLTRMWSERPLASPKASAGSSWMKAAVLSLNRPMSGTCSHFITARASATTSAGLSLKVPVRAVTSIIGMASLLRL